jgi:hypothetical protein
VSEPWFLAHGVYIDPVGFQNVDDTDAPREQFDPLSLRVSCETARPGPSNGMGRECRITN